MTSPRRFEQDVPALLADLYLAGIPDYRDDLVRQVAGTRQRPAWTFPGRWLPMELTTTRVPTTRLPMRQLGVLALIAILVAALFAAYIGTHQQKLPPPFGVAGNGLIAYSKDGDIFTVDPMTGVTKAVVTGPDTDLDPEFSPDGTKIDFARERGKTGKFDLAVANADGSAARVVTTEPLPEDASAQFTPDSSAIIASGQNGIQRIDLSGAKPPIDIARGRYVAGTIRATDGAILFENDDDPGIDLWVMNADGSNKRLLWDTGLDGDYQDLQQYRWSPDGTKIAYTCSDQMTHQGSFICLMNDDGSNRHKLTDEGAAWYETDLKWSPDGKSIAFNRWHQANGSTGYLVSPIGVVSVDGGAVRSVGEDPSNDGALFDWSPDGKLILSLPARFVNSPVGAGAFNPIAIDVATGSQESTHYQIYSNVSWQRVATN
jgi:Tol biopolymer transport system component